VRVFLAAVTSARGLAAARVRSGPDSLFFVQPGHDAVCLETQHYPDAVNQAAFPSPVIAAGTPSTSVTEFTFCGRSLAGRPPHGFRFE